VRPLIICRLGCSFILEVACDYINMDLECKESANLGSRVKNFPFFLVVFVCALVRTGE
jgi:hypothetical protein